MKPSSLRRNLLTISGLYAVSLVAAAGCPAGRVTPPGNDAQSAVPDIQRQPVGAQMQDWSGAAQAQGAEIERKVDAAHAREQFFRGWPKPKLALVITGRQDGYLEPCGCAGLENQKGGLSRRYALFKQLRDQHWPLAAIDAGGLVRRFGTQAEIQFNIASEALKIMGYKAVGFGSDDLRLSATAIAAAASEQNIFTSANVNVFNLTPKFRIIKAGSMTLGVTSIIGPDFQKEVNNPDIEFTPAEEALKAVLPELKGCDQRILLAYASRNYCKELAKKFPQFDFIVSAEGVDEPADRLAIVPGAHAQLIEVGHKGMYAVVLGFYDDPNGRVRYQRVALDSRFHDSPEMKQLMASYQDQLQSMGWKELGLRASRHPRASDKNPLSGRFVGAAACKECHAEAWEVWHNSKHAHATETLAKLNPPRQYDPECISCHSTGWNPKEFAPYKYGFDSLAKTPHLAGNGCENCHGPGAAHVAAENGKNTVRQAELRKLIKLTVANAEEQVCAKCHDLDNSPEFFKPGAFEKYWKQIEH